MRRTNRFLILALTLLIFGGLAQYAMRQGWNGNNQAGPKGNGFSTVTPSALTGSRNSPSTQPDIPAALPVKEAADRTVAMSLTDEAFAKGAPLYMRQFGGKFIKVFGKVRVEEQTKDGEPQNVGLLFEPRPGTCIRCRFESTHALDSAILLLGFSNNGATTAEIMGRLDPASTDGSSIYLRECELVSSGQ